MLEIMAPVQAYWRGRRHASAEEQDHSLFLLGVGFAAAGSPAAAAAAGGAGAASSSGLLLLLLLLVSSLLLSLILAALAGRTNRPEYGEQHLTALSGCVNVASAPQLALQAIEAALSNNAARQQGEV
jgi:hypothetical protein